MGEIYETAVSVAVYLGKATEKTEEAMRVLGYFTRTASSVEEPPWLFTQLPATEDLLKDILTRHWFTRIWTVQEASLAQHTTLICGQHEISWQGSLRSLRSIVFRIKAAAISPYFATASEYQSELDWSPLLDILETQMRQAARREGAVLYRNQLDLAYDFRHRKSVEPRDKYYAIFSIIENDQGAGLRLQPNYECSLEDLHRQFTTEIQRISEIEDVRLNSVVVV